MSLLRVSMLVVVVSLALAGACVEARTLFPVDKASDSDGPCWSYKDEDGCLDNECSWCKTTLLGATCVPAAIGRRMPLALANCNNPPEDDIPTQQAPGDDPKPKPQAVSCGDNDNKDDCLELGAQEGQCAWCKGDFMPASCVGLKAAEWIPETVAKCKLPPKPDQQDALTLVNKGHSKKRHHDDKKKDKPPAKCMDNKEKRDCTHLGAEEGDCAWCAGNYMPGQCLPSMVAQWIPAMVADCKGPSKHHKKAEAADLEVQVEAGGGKDKPKPKPPVSCGDNKEKHDCLHLGAEEGDCAWCAGDFMPPSCVSTQAAKWIPGTVAKCKLPKTADSTMVVDAPESTEGVEGVFGVVHAPESFWEGVEEVFGLAGKHGKGKKKKKLAATCMDNDNKKGCLRGSEEGECAWCDGGYMPEGKCLAAMAAKFLPEMVAKCKMSKEQQLEEEAVVLDTAEDDEQEDDGEQEEQEEQLAAGEDTPGDDPKPKPQAVSCGDNDNKEDCLELGAQEGQCAWCKGDFMPASCVGLKAAEWIPETVAKCKLPAKQEAVATS